MSFLLNTFSSFFPTIPHHSNPSPLSPSFFPFLLSPFFISFPSPPFPYVSFSFFPSSFLANLSISATFLVAPLPRYFVFLSPANETQYFGTPCSRGLGGHSLFAGDEGQTLLEFAKRCLVCLWVRYLVHNLYIFGVADEKI